MDFSSFDRRGYPVVSVEAGYAEWANNYDATVTAGLDQPLLDSLTSVNWRQVRRAADLACGTGRTEEWLAGKPKWREYVNWPVSFALVWTN